MGVLHSESSLSSLEVMLFLEDRVSNGANMLLHQRLNSKVSLELGNRN